MDFKLEQAIEVEAQEFVTNAKSAELNELQLLLVGGGCGDVIFA